MKSQLSPHLGSSHILLGRESMLSSPSIPRREEKNRQKQPMLSFRKKLRWVASALVFGPIVYALSIMYSAAPVYRAEATLLIDSSSNHSLSGDAQDTKCSRLWTC